MLLRQVMGKESRVRILLLAKNRNESFGSTMGTVQGYKKEKVQSNLIPGLMYMHIYIFSVTLVIACKFDSGIAGRASSYPRENIEISKSGRSLKTSIISEYRILYIYTSMGRGRRVLYIGQEDRKRRNTQEEATTLPSNGWCTD